MTQTTTTTPAPEPNGDRSVPSAPRVRDNLKATLRDAMDYRALMRSPYGFTPAAVLGAIGFFAGFEALVFTFGAPEIARRLEIDVGGIIDILIMVQGISLVVSIVVGYWLDRARRAPFIGIGTIVGGIFGIFSGTANSFAHLSWTRVGATSSRLLADVPLYALATDYYPHETRGKAFAFVGILSDIARLLAPIGIGVALAVLGVKSAFIVFGVPVVLVGVVALLTLREPVRGYFDRQAAGLPEELARQEDEPMSLGESWRTTWSIKTLRRWFIASIFSGGVTEFTSVFVVFYFAEIYGLSPLERGFAFMPSAAVSFLGGFVGGGLVDRFIRINPSRLLLFIGGAGLLTTPIWLIYLLEPPLWLLITILLPFQLGLALTGPAASVVIAQIVPPNIRTLGLQMRGLSLLPGILLFAPLARTLFQEYGYESVFIAAFVFSLIGGIIFISGTGLFPADQRAQLAGLRARSAHEEARRKGLDKLLVCRDIDVHYGGVQVLFGVDFDVTDGEIVALLGTNGAGKSTLLRAISGTQEASSGAVVFDGRDITHMPPHEIAARGVVQMPGGRGIFPDMTVRDNLVLANWLVPDPEEARRRIGEAVALFPVLQERLEARAGDLSGGQQQQLSLAQAMMARPRLLLIDELSLGLAPAVVGELIDAVKRINDSGVTVVVVEQSVNVAMQLATKAIFMEKGEVRFFGETDALRNRPDILRAVYVKGAGAALTDKVPASARRSERTQRRMDLAATQPVLEVHDVSKRYGGITAVDGVSFALRDGEILGLIGPNGAGKTTLFDIISGHQAPDEGHVVYEGMDITRSSPDERARRGLIRRFQDAKLFPSLTVYETLLVSLEQQLEVRSSVLNAARLPRARRAERRIRVRADRLLELLELDAYADKFVKELSTGLRRITDLACVLASEPKVLLLDEPSSGIAQAETEALGPLLRRVHVEAGCSILLIEHDMSLISAVSDELIAFDQGQLVVRGAPAEVLDDERVVASYLGSAEAAIQRSGSLT